MSVAHNATSLPSGPEQVTSRISIKENHMTKGQKKKGTDKNQPAKTLKEKKQAKKDKKKQDEKQGIFPE